jgi:hypothetical protein
MIRALALMSHYPNHIIAVDTVISIILHYQYLFIITARVDRVDILRYPLRIILAFREFLHEILTSAVESSHIEIRGTLKDM